MAPSPLDTLLDPQLCCLPRDPRGTGVADLRRRHTRAGSLPAEEILPPLAPFGQSPQTAGLDGVRWQAIPWLIGR